jgi:hypothetical protein
MPAKKTDRDVDALYGLQLGEFTQGRDELARRLSKEGKRKDANAVKALRKPTVAAWALNQIARRRAADVKRLLAAGKRLRKAHEALLRGGNRAALQDASAAERELVDELARDATALAAEAGAASGATLDERIRNTLHAAALDEETAAELAAGRLVRDREAVGSFGEAAVAPRPAKDTRSARRSEREDSKGTRALRRELERALAGVKADEQKARREHTRASRAAERAARSADDTQRRAEKAREALREARQHEKAAAADLQRAVRAVEAAERKLG